MDDQKPPYGDERLAFHVVDVFTDRAFAGNPLAVVLGADGLSDGQLAAIASEFNLSETAFPVAPVDPVADYRLRIFTPESELPFAGHPSVGSAWTLASLGRLNVGTVRQECGAGVVELEISSGGGPVRLRGAAPVVGVELKLENVLPALGLDPADHAGPPVLAAGTGLDFGFVLVRPEALGRLTVSPAALRALAGAGAGAGLWVGSWDEASATAQARVFPAGVGLVEDPATGSAALGLGAYLVAVGLLSGAGESAYRVVQGVEMGRRSELACTVAARGGLAVSCTVAGSVVPVSSGTIRVPAG